MSNLTKRIAIVPARAGSKRIPKKNIRNFCGKPILSYILHAIQDSFLFDVVHVSTDSTEIASIAEAEGFPVDFYRPLELADDITPLYPVVRYVLSNYLKRDVSFDTAALLMPCSPLISSSDLVQACSTFEDSPHNLPLLSVTEYAVPIQWAFDIDNQSVLSPHCPNALVKRSQDLPTAYYDAGQFEFFSPDALLNLLDDSFSQYIGYILPRTRCVDIDTDEDWNIAEALFRSIHSIL